MDEFLAAAKDAVSTPFKYGHCDVGEAFVMLMQGELTEEEATEKVKSLGEYYKKSLEKLS